MRYDAHNGDADAAAAAAAGWMMMHTVSTVLCTVRDVMALITIPLGLRLRLFSSSSF